MSAQILQERVQVAVAEPVVAEYSRPPSVWRRVRGAVAEMNYVSRRMVELQAPWIADNQPHQPRHRVSK
jgi:hypothetical protein